MEEFRQKVCTLRGIELEIKHHKNQEGMLRIEFCHVN